MPTVLVADDDLDLLPILSEALTEEGWTVLSAASGVSALAVARSSPIDVILADVVMEDMSGPALEAAFKLDPALEGIPSSSCRQPWQSFASSRRPSSFESPSGSKKRPLSLRTVCGSTAADRFRWLTIITVSKGGRDAPRCEISRIAREEVSWSPVR
jgi:hypothetical protein